MMAVRDITTTWQVWHNQRLATCQLHSRAYPGFIHLKCAMIYKMNMCYVQCYLRLVNKLIMSAGKLLIAINTLQGRHFSIRTISCPVAGYTDICILSYWLGENTSLAHLCICGCNVIQAKLYKTISHTNSNHGLNFRPWLLLVCDEKDEMRNVMLVIYNQHNISHLTHLYSVFALVRENVPHSSSQY